MPNKLLETLTIDSASMDIAQTNPDASDDSTQAATDEFVQNAILRRLPNNRLSSTVSDRSIPNNAMTATGCSITIPADGFGFLRGYVSFAANATGRRACVLKRNGLITSQIYIGAAPSGVMAFETVTFNRVGINDVITLDVTQNSGGALNLATAWLEVYFIPD